MVVGEEEEEEDDDDAGMTIPTVFCGLTSPAATAEGGSTGC